MKHRAVCSECDWTGEPKLMNGAARDADEHRDETGHAAKIERAAATDGGRVQERDGVDQPTAVDLFCGAGGASCGIHAAGFDVVAGVDKNAVALDTHAENLPGYTVRHDLTDVDPSILPERARSPAYLHGSPPCKGFSTANDGRDIDDERNSLVFRFTDWLAALRPRVATMENVTGMTNITTHFMDRVEAAFREAGYAVRWRTLNAADYGVPQTRRRVITIGVREDLPAPSRWFPAPTHAETPTTTLDGGELAEWVTVEEAISDLGRPVGDHRPQGENNGTSAARWRGRDEPSHTLKTGGTHVTRPDGGFQITDQVNEPHQKAGRRPMVESDEPANAIRAGTAPLKVPNHEAMNSNRQRLAQIEPGTAPSAAMSRVAADEPSNTLVAGKAAPPAHYRTIPNHNPREATEYEAHDYESDAPATTITGARLTERGHHESQFEGARRLTVRECARLQSFPDWFVFTGTKTSQYAQVGNAVPPRLQYHVAGHLRDEVLRY
ncbi:DNA cytosine methyltransferase [Halorubrum sodomense]|uniref:DNA (cytosine-5-)-methyltransferase n=1 Tax=Halorubrum sodomense TaxID=35743 RepID=A0A1I6HY69_HALSD|nr:DNA cytosine methyltransferase [Halorubrum sodomense]SFR59432.1 C-5 cytosine-specific DNA methylase [Halorubrum sodomense]